MIAYIPGVGPVNDSIAAGQPGGPPATVPTGAQAVPVDSGQSTALPSTDPTTAPAPINDPAGDPTDPTNAVDGVV